MATLDTTRGGTLVNSGWRLLRIGYAPCDATLTRPGDRRRFCYWARRRGLAFEIADPSREYDVVFVAPTADLSTWLRYRRGKVIYELIDSYLAQSRLDPRSLLRGVAKFAVRQNRRLLLDYRRGMETMCRRAEAVVCSTEAQAQQIRSFNHNVHVLLDFQAADVHRVKTDYRAGGVFNIVWEGLPDTMPGLALLRDALQRLRQRHRIALHVVTDLEYYRFLANRYGRGSTRERLRSIAPGAFLYAWNAATMSPIVTACDLAVIPLRLDHPLWAGKPANKLFLFWRMAMPAVVSATPAYLRAMQESGVEAACRTSAEWEEMLARHIEDEATRRRNAELGKQYVDRRFDETALLGQWDAMFESVVGEPARS